MTDPRSLRYADADGATIVAQSDGLSVAIPADVANADFAELIRTGAEIAAFRRWEDLATAQAALVAAVKAEAQARILAVMPEWKQRNATAHGVAMVRKVQLGGTLSAEEEAAEATYTAAWGLVSQIRAASDAKEAEIAALADLDAAEAFDLNAGWPA